MPNNTNEISRRGRRPDTIESLRERLREATESLFTADLAVDRARERATALERERDQALAAVRAMAALLVVQERS